MATRKSYNPKNYEDAVVKLKEITLSLEEGNLSLEQMMDLYEKGRKLVLYCEKQLNNFEERIERIEKSDKNSESSN